MEGLKQKSLETVLPRIKGEVFVVLGQNRGKRGQLLNKDAERESASVQLHRSGETVLVSFEEVCEFCGHDEWM